MIPYRLRCHVAIISSKAAVLLATLVSFPAHGKAIAIKLEDRIDRRNVRGIIANTLPSPRWTIHNELLQPLEFTDFLRDRTDDVVLVH
jgi:hypothetical protein